MPARQRLATVPADYLAAGQEWPNGRLSRGAPPEAALVAGIASRILEAMGDLSIRELARRSEVSPQTVSNLLAGRTWGDVVTLARIERALGVPLWGDEHHATSLRPLTRRTVKARPGDGKPVRGTAQLGRTKGEKG